MTTTTTRKPMPASLEFRAQVNPSSYNPETREFEVVFATDTPVTRWDWDSWEPFDEVLELTPQAVDLERLNSGAPFLKDHHNSVDTTIGVVRKAWVEGGKGYAKIFLDDGPENEAIARKLQNGVLGNVSVGYRVTEYEKGKKGENQARATYLATKWTPYEISLVGVPADHKSKMRSEGGATPYFVNVIETRMENNENKPVEQPPVTPPVTPPATGVSPEEAQRMAAEAAKRESERTLGIIELSRKLNLGSEFSEKLIKDGVSLDKARSLAIDEMAKGPANSIQNSASVKTNTPTDRDHKRAGIADALALASGYVRTNQLSDEEVKRARFFQNEYGTSILGLARTALIDAGEKPADVMRMNGMELIGRAITNSTGDFPIYLEGTNRRTLMAAYQSQDLVWRKVCATGSVNDFRRYEYVHLAGTGTLPRKLENQEYQGLAMTDGEKYSYSVATYGGMLNISREMMVNDDLGALMRHANMLGQTAAMTIEKIFFQILAENSWHGPILTANGITAPLFDAQRGNLTALGITNAGFEEIMKLMSAHIMPGSNPSSPMFIQDINPDMLMVDRTQLYAAMRVNNNEYDQSVSNKSMPRNLSFQTFREIVKGNQLPPAAKVAFAFADPARHPVFQASFLNGVQEPTIESKRSWDVDGTEWKIRLDVGIDVVGFRGGVKVSIP